MYLPAGDYKGSVLDVHYCVLCLLGNSGGVDSLSEQIKTNVNNRDEAGDEIRWVF